MLYATTLDHRSFPRVIVARNRLSFEPFDSAVGRRFLAGRRDKLKMRQHEAGCPATEGIILCGNNCGFFGSVATMNACFECHKEMILKQEKAKLATLSNL
ncbi:hypothetical protein GW17_00044549 [Ensete ventricosum]|nr:hypothetical protein GW17_00044549 [Ensete ventricosum]